MAPPTSSDATGLALSQDAARTRLRELSSVLDARRDAIAELDLEIEDLLRELSDFQAHLAGRLAAEQAALARVDGLVRTIERWRELLASRPAEAVPEEAARIEARRQREVERLQDLRQEAERRASSPVEEAEEAAAPEPSPAPEPARADRLDRLKTVYRALARRFHPDLARTEAERVTAGRTMGRINELYHRGDLERLEALAEQVKGGEIDAPELDPDAQVELLEERLAWFDAVLENLHDERRRLERTPTCELMRDHRQARSLGRDLVEELREDLHQRVRDAWRDVGEAARTLEETVSRYNARDAGARALTPSRRATALERLFDPDGSQALARLALDELATDRTDPHLRDEAAALEAWAAQAPARLRLVLLAWVGQLSPFPLPGLGSWEDLARRFDHLSFFDRPRPSLEETLAELADVLEYGVRRATEQVVHVGLRFRSATLRGAVPLALERPAVRRVFKDVLRVVSEEAECEACRRAVFPVPLMRSHGVDDLRALVCPACGTTLARYWMPKGDDVQSVLNEAYLDLELVTEWSVRLGRGRLATQLLPVEVDAMTVGDLKRRLHEDLFVRYDLEVRRGQLALVQDGRRVREATPLSILDDTAFTLRFAADVETSEAEALELLRHRVRNRFR